MSAEVWAQNKWVQIAGATEREQDIVIAPRSPPPININIKEN